MRANIATTHLNHICKKKHYFYLDYMFFNPRDDIKYMKDQQ